MKRRYRIFIDVSRAPDWVRLICRLNRNARVIVRWMTPTEAGLLTSLSGAAPAFLHGLGGIFKNIDPFQLKIEKVVEDTAAGTRY